MGSRHDPVGGRPLHLTRDAGGFTLDADLLARIFGWSTEALRERMHQGLVTSKVERGEGADQGRWRLAVQCGNRRWQAIVGPDGEVMEQHLDFVSAGSSRDGACPRQE